MHQLAKSGSSMTIEPTQALVPAMSSFEGAVLVADIGGFTALTEQLSRADFGVELLTKCINDCFARVSRGPTELLPQMHDMQSGLEHALSS